MSFFHATYQALSEADEERLRRLAAMGDTEAQRELEHLAQRKSPAPVAARGDYFNWQEIAHRWSSGEIRKLRVPDALERFERRGLSLVKASPVEKAVLLSVILIGQTAAGQFSPAGRVSPAYYEYRIQPVKNDYTGGVDRLVIPYPGYGVAPDLQSEGNPRFRELEEILQNDAMSTRLGEFRTLAKRAERSFYDLFNKYLPL